MTTINILNILVNGENIMTVYRNRCVQGNCVKHFVKLRVVLEVCVILVMFAYIFNRNYVSLTTTHAATFKIVFVLYYVTFEMVNSLSAIILGYLCSDHFEEFVSNFDAVNQLYINDSSFESFTKSRYVRFKIDLALFTVFQVGITSLYLFDLLPVIVQFNFAIIHFSIATMHQCRYFYEHFVFFEFIEIIIGHLRFINDSVAKVINRLSNECIEDDGDLSEVSEELEKWGEGCRLLTASNDRLRDFFGFQVEFK